MGIFSNIRDILKEIPLSDVLREKLLVAERSIEALEKENMDLKQKNADMSKEIDELKKEMSAIRVTEKDFVEERGAFFKRKPGGGYHVAVYCPGCKMPLSSFGGNFPYYCDRCKISLDFSFQDLPEILKGLPK